MKNKLLLGILLSVSFIFYPGQALAQFGDGNCTDKDPAAEKYCNDFMLKYGFFVTDQEKTDLKARHTLQSLEDFTQQFWKNRDIDPATSQNEFKELIDQRLSDIESEILYADLDVSGTMFSTSGGLRGDMAHVYLFYGMPHFKRKLRGIPGIMVDISVWHYFDENGNVLFRFLFLDKLGRVYLFDRYNFMFQYVLEELSVTFLPSADILQRIWDYISWNDPDYVFMTSLLVFSHYSDVTLARALEAPNPISLIAERNAPSAIGQPNITAARKYLFNNSNSTIDASLGIKYDRLNRLSMDILIRHGGLDWEIEEDKGRANLDLRISFQNKKTRALHEFEVRFSFHLDLNLIKSSPDSFFRLELDGLKNFRDGENHQGMLRDLLVALDPGEYVVNLDLRDTHTKKYVSWQEVMVKK